MLDTSATLTMEPLFRYGEAANMLPQATTVHPRSVLSPNIEYRVDAQRAVGGGRQQWH